MSNQDFIRWYDLNPRVSQASRLLFTFPDAVQTIISEAIILISERQFNEKKWEAGARSLGKEKVLGLHKSKNRRREYDHNPMLHQAMNQLYMLSDENRIFLAEHILKMVQYIQNYLQMCSETQNLPQEGDIAHITKQYVTSGEASVQTFLENLRQEFLGKLQNGEDPHLEQEVTEFQESIARDSKHGMKLSRADAGL